MNHLTAETWKTQLIICIKIYIQYRGAANKW